MLNIKSHLATNIILYAIILFAVSYIFKSRPIDQPNMMVLLVFGIVIMGLSLILTPVMLIISANQKCGKPKPGFEGEAVGRGVMVGILTYIFFLAFYFIKIIREPFTSFLGEDWYAYGVGLAFYCSISVAIWVTVNYFDGLRSACRIPVSQCLENIKPYLESQRYVTEEEMEEDEELSSNI